MSVNVFFVGYKIWINQFISASKVVEYEKWKIHRLDQTKVACWN